MSILKKIKSIIQSIISNIQEIKSKEKTTWGKWLDEHPGFPENYSLKKDKPGNFVQANYPSEKQKKDSYPKSPDTNKENPDNLFQEEHQK